MLTGPAPIEALNRSFELAARLGGAMEQGLEDLGLTVARATVIWQIHNRGPMTQRELSRLLEVTPRNVTGLIDALEATGFVTREPHPSDRRATLVTLTDRGRDVGGLRDTGYQEFAARLFVDIPAEHLAAFVATLDQVLTRLRSGQSGDPGPEALPEGICES
jgi:DNA-binding MarR family transcriptional regulator